MEVILLEKIKRLGNVGDLVNVKDGYARNCLLPHGKALRASEEGKKIFEQNRAELEKRSHDAREKAEALAKEIRDLNVLIAENASESGRLYGSITPKEISVSLSEMGHDIPKSKIVIGQHIKEIGIFKAGIDYHPDVEIEINVVVGRTIDEAQKILNKSQTQAESKVDDAAQYQQTVDISASEESQEGDSAQDI